MPSRDVCTSRRIASNSPLQALVTLNDEAYIELAGGLAERMHAAGGTAAEQISAGYHILLGRRLPISKGSRLGQLYEEAQQEFDANRPDAEKLAPDADRYALVIVANALLNLDEALTK